MSEETKTFQIQSSALSDRGLNERRPLPADMAAKIQQAIREAR